MHLTYRMKDKLLGAQKNNFVPYKIEKNARKLR